MVDQATGEFLLVATIRLAVGCYFARLLCAGCHVIGRVPTRSEVFVWAIGCFAYVIHVVCAFEFAHGWSHVVALDYIAIETERVTGIRRGEGLWVNYLFTLIWIADVVRSIVAAGQNQPTNRRVDIAVQGFMAFIVFNATVVFGPAIYRWLLIPIGVAMWIAWKIRSQRLRL